MSAIAPFARPLYVMLKPVGSRCNLACTYCYYREKAEVCGAAPLMSEAVLERFTREYLTAQTQPEVVFTWHGGEPLLLPLDFYRHAVALQRRYGAGRRIENVLQTNATLLTEAWCEFLAEQRWLVGVSIDGTPEMHDRYRRDLRGGGSWRSVMAGIERLNRYGVAWNVMATVNAGNVGAPREFYRALRSLGAPFIQFTPIVERRSTCGGHRLAQPADAAATLTAESVTPEAWGDFLCGVLDEWRRQGDVGRVFIQLIESTLSLWAGGPAGLCSQGTHCGHAAVLEANGDLYACDHFVFPEHRLGNIMTHSLVAMMYGQQQCDFAARKMALPHTCRACRYLRLCHGDCLRTRFVTSPDDGAPQPYLCAGYRQFFDKLLPIASSLIAH